jgi:hypothetical protein
MVEGFPAVLLLAGDDEDLRAGAGFAIAGNVGNGDVAEAVHRGRQQTEVGEVPALVSATAAWGLAGDRHVFTERTRHPDIEADAVTGVSQ